jgi:hypothetical protein
VPRRNPTEARYNPQRDDALTREELTFQRRPERMRKHGAKWRCLHRYFALSDQLVREDTAYYPAVTNAKKYCKNKSL